MPRPISTVWEHFLVLCETDGKKHVTCSYCTVPYKHAMANKLKQHLLNCMKCPNDVKNLYKQNNVPTILHTSPETTVSPPTSTSSTMAPSSSTIAPSSSAMELSAVTPLPSASIFNSDASHNTTFTITMEPDPLPTEIKQESMLETALLSNGHCKVIGTDRLCSESDESAQSSDEECVDAGQGSEPLLNSIYPKWLMDIEQKRANADLRRAKAEEQRAEVAIKTAEAMLIQTEALRKMSEAAERQADAILRIAMVMENRNRPDDLINNMQSRRLPGYQ